MASEPALLAGQLLLAHPSLRDPNFRRSIIYLADHDDEKGSLGFILNRPTEQTLGSLTEEALSPEMAGIPVFIGGPVQAQQVIIARLEWDELLEELNFHSILKMGEMEFEDDESARGLHAFIGYAGWGEQQLASEYAEGAWIVCPPSAAAINADSTTWKSLMQSLGPQFHLLAEQPDDPTLN